MLSFSASNCGLHPFWPATHVMLSERYVELWLRKVPKCFLAAPAALRPFSSAPPPSPTSATRTPRPHQPPETSTVMWYGLDATHGTSSLQVPLGSPCRSCAQPSLADVVMHTGDITFKAIQQMTPTFIDHKKWNQLTCAIGVPLRCIICTYVHMLKS